MIKVELGRISKDETREWGGIICPHCFNTFSATELYRSSLLKDDRCGGLEQEGASNAEFTCPDCNGVSMICLDIVYYAQKKWWVE